MRRILLRRAALADLNRRSARAAVAARPAGRLHHRGLSRGGSGRAGDCAYTAEGYLRQCGAIAVARKSLARILPACWISEARDGAVTRKVRARDRSRGSDAQGSPGAAAYGLAAAHHGRDRIGGRRCVVPNGSVRLRRHPVGFSGPRPPGGGPGNGSGPPAGWLGGAEPGRGAGACGAAPQRH